MHPATAQLFRADNLAGSRFYERWSGEEDGALILDDDRLVAHSGYVSTAGSARAHYDGDLGDTVGGHCGL